MYICIYIKIKTITANVIERPFRRRVKVTQERGRATYCGSSLQITAYFFERKRQCMSASRGDREHYSLRGPR